MPDPTTLSEKNRAKLDGIVKQMTDNNESDDNIKFVVEDFKKKYAEKKNPIGTSSSPGKNSELAPKTGSSAGKNSNGFPKIDTNSIAPNFEEMKPAIENPVGKEKRLRKELSNVKVTPENMDAVMAETDALSATIKSNQKAKEQARSNRVKELETYFYDATRNNDDDTVAEQRLQDAVQVNGVWNNVKSIAKKSYNTAIDAISSTSPTLFALQKAKVNTDPLGEEKKQVQQQAIKNKETLTESEITQRAQEIFKEKEKDNLFIDRANSFLDNLDSKDKELLKQDRALKADHLEEENLKRLKVVSAMRTVADEKISEYKSLEKQLSKLRENGKPFPEDLYDQYTSLGSEIKNIGSELQKNEDYILKNKKDLGTAQQELDLFKREYGDVKNFIGNVGTSALELGLGFLSGLDYLGSFGGAIGDDKKNKEIQKDFAEKTNQIKGYRETLRNPVESVESTEGFLNYASDLVANQIPILVATSTGAEGLAAIGTSSSGQKFTEMNTEVREGKEKYSPFQMAVAPLLYGASEVISELPTLSILKKGGRVIESIAKNEGELIAKTAKQKAVEWAKDFSVDMGKEMTGEEFTQFAQNFNDKFVLGKKDVNLLDNTGQVFKDTFTLTSMLKVAPHMFGAVVKPFQSKIDLGTLDENSRKIIEFSKQLNDENLTETEKNVIKKQIDKATAESSKIVKNTIGKIDNMPSELYDEVVNLNTRAGEIKAQAREINDGNLSNKTELLKGLEEDYKALQEKRNGIIEGNTTVVDILPLKEQEKLKKQALEDLVTELNPDGKKNIKITNEQVVERANEIYNESKSNNSTDKENLTVETAPKIKETEKTEGNSPLPTAVAQENGSGTEVNLPQKEKSDPEIVRDSAIISQNQDKKPQKMNFSEEEKSKIQKKVVEKPRVILRSGKVGTDAFFALPNEGVFGEVVDKVGNDEKVTAYRYPKDFKIKDLSNDVVFDDYMSNKMYEDTKKEGYDAAYIMEIDGSKVLHVINPEKLTLLDERLPELRNNETISKPNTATDGNVRPGAESLGESGTTEQENLGKENVSPTAKLPTSKGEVGKKLQEINKNTFGLDEKQSRANAVIMEKTIETMAKRSGISKEEMFDKINFEKGDANTIEKLSKKGKALFQIVGENAELKDTYRNNLEVAKSLESKGKNEKEIWVATGWQKGVDGKWRTEVDDSKMIMDKDFMGMRGYTLGEAIQYDDLFELYPDLKNVKVSVIPNLGNMLGAYLPTKNLIMLNGARSKAQARSTLLHEIQHIVQGKEGFATGGTAKMANDYLIKKMKSIQVAKNIPKGLAKAASKLNSSLFNGVNIESTKEEFNAELNKAKKFLTKDVFDLYQSIAGEVESRNVQKRMNMTSEERQNTPLSETEDVARDEQIVLFQGEQGAMLAEDGKFIIYALEDPNLSTPLHEMAHVYEHYLTDAEKKTVLEDAGHNSWTRETSEHFARGFEKYLADGIAPNPEMKKLFEEFKKWLTNIYNGIKNSDIDIKISPEMKKVFDAMLEGKVNDDKSITVGEYNYSYSNGEWVAKNKDDKIEKNKDIPKKVLDIHADNFDFTKGETALDAQKINDISTWEEDVAEHSNNPVEVAETLLNAQAMDATEGLDTKSKHIAETIGGKGVERSSFVQRSGKKGMKDIPGSLALQYFAKKGQGQELDIIAQNAEIAMYGDWDPQNPRITEDDVFDFINENPRGTNDFLNSVKKEKINALKTAFTHLTGLPANEKFLHKAIEQQRSKDKFVNEYMTEIDALSDEDLLNLQTELDQFNNSPNEKETDIKSSGENKSTVTDSQESKGQSGVQGESGQNDNGSQESEEVTPKTSSEQFLDWLDEMENNLDQFGKENLSSGIPVVLAKASVQAMRLALKSGKTITDIIKDGIDIIKQSEWFKNLSKSDQIKTENFFEDNINITEIFNSNPELTKIGSKNQYYDYIKTIFPNSKIKDIVFHGTMEKLIPKDNFKGFVTYFSTNKKYSETFGFPVDRKIVFVKLNINNPFNSKSELADVPEEIHNTDQYTNARFIKSQNSNNYDSVIGTDSGQKEGKTIVVFEPEQIHILGSEKDAKSFKQWVDKKNINSTKQFLNWLDKKERELNKFGNENMSVGIPIVVAKAAIQAMRVAVKSGMAIADVIQAGLDTVKQSDWYINLSAAEKKQAEKDFNDSFGNPQIDNPSERQTENLLNRSVSDKISEDDAYDEVKATFEKARTELDNKKTFKEYSKEAYRNFVKRFTDRQYLAKSLLNKSGMKAVQNLIINSHGASGKAKIQFDEAYNEIYKGLTTEERKTLDEIIQSKRFIAIDENREARGLEPVSHPNFIDKNKSEKFLSKLEKELGTEKYNDLVKRSEAYFKTYKGLLKDMLGNGLISQESYDSMSDVDYQPRVFLQFVTDFNGDLETNKRANNIDSGGLSADQIKSMSEGDASSLVLNSEWLLANSLLSRSKAMAMNNINKRFMTDAFPKALEKFKSIDPKNFKNKEEERFYKYFKELSSKVIDNPIIGKKESGNPKFKYDKTPANFGKAYYYIDGKRHEFFLENELHESWNDNVGSFLSSNAKEFISYASGAALVKAIATGNNPAFPIVNTPRDFMFTTTFSDQYSNIVPKAMMQVAKDVVKSIKEIRKSDSDILKKYIEYGGAMDFLSSQGTLKKESLLGQAIDKAVSANTRDTAKSIFSKVTLHKISAYSEMMFRLGIFQRSIKNQLNELGLNDISEVTDKQQLDEIYSNSVASARSILDFNQGGAITKDLESIIPYINVAFQGGRVAADAFRKDPVGTTSRVLQVATMASAVPIGMSLALISAMKADDDNDKSSYDIYLDALSGISRYQKMKYINIVTGVKDDEGQYQVIKIAKAQELSPVMSITDDIYNNFIKKLAGKEKKSAFRIIDDAAFTFNSNVMPVDVTSPAGLFTRNPMIKATLTYATGYDFFREEPLSSDIGKVPKAVEGLNNPNVEDFYKKLGEEHGLSPVRSKAFVESLITGPDTNPFVGMLYGGADAAVSDKGMGEIGKDLAKSVYKSTGKRVISYTSDFNRQLEANKDLQDKIDQINIEKYKMKAEFNQLAKDYINKDISKADLNKKLQELEPDDRIRMINKIKDKIQLKGIDGTILDIKYEKEPEAKALMIMHYYGDISDGSKESKHILSQMLRAKGILTPKVMAEYNKLKQELSKQKTTN